MNFAYDSKNGGQGLCDLSYKEGFIITLWASREAEPWDNLFWKILTYF